VFRACAALTVPSIAPVIAARLECRPRWSDPTSRCCTSCVDRALAGGGVVLRFGAVRLSQACLIGVRAGLALTLLAGRQVRGVMGLVSSRWPRSSSGWVNGTRSAGLTVIVADWRRRTGKILRPRDNACGVMFS